MKLFSTEQVSKWHPDKYADQISDAILRACLLQDKTSRVACEVLVKGTTVVLAGEITTQANVDYAQEAHKVAHKLGYTVGNIVNLIETQSPEIANGVGTGVDMAAGDQGMMYGYATSETESMLPFGFDLANKIIAAIEDDIINNPNTILKGDAKCQVTVDLDLPSDMNSVQKILVSACHKENTYELIKGNIKGILKTIGVPDTVEVIVNPAGSWVIGGPAADCGLTGRKIVCDQYGGYCPVGGGAFSGKDPSKVDRSGAYIARQIACDLVREFDLAFIEVQLAYAIGQKEPMSVSVSSSNPDMDEMLSNIAQIRYDLTPGGIIKYLNLLDKDYEKLAEGCHYREII